MARRRLRQFVASPSTWKAMFDPRSVYVRFVVDKVALRQVSLPVLQFSLVHVIPPMLHTNLHLLAAVNRRTNGRNLETFKKVMLFRKSGNSG